VRQKLVFSSVCRFVHPKTIELIVITTHKPLQKDKFYTESCHFYDVRLVFCSQATCLYCRKMFNTHIFTTSMILIFFSHSIVCVSNSFSVRKLELFSFIARYCRVFLFIFMFEWFMLFYLVLCVPNPSGICITLYPREAWGINLLQKTVSMRGAEGIPPTLQKTVSMRGGRRNSTHREMARVDN
jgi:hypothetical protein